MPVRDSSEWRHGIVQKKVINHDSGDGRKIICAWDTCENDGYEMYHIRVRTHDETYAKADPRNERFMHYVFCSERHKQYWLAAIRPGNNNNLPPGLRHVL